MNESNLELYASRKNEVTIFIPILYFSKLFIAKDENINEINIYDIEPNDKKNFVEKANLYIHKTLGPIISTLVKLSQNLIVLFDSANSGGNLKIVESNDFTKNLRIELLLNIFEGLVFLPSKIFN